MRTIDIGIDKIDKIYHIADVHVRNVKRHKEYRSVFQRLYHYISQFVNYLDIFINDFGS